VSHKTGVTPRLQHVTMFKAESNVGHKICRPADLAINTMWAFMGALGVSRQLGVVSPAYGVYRPTNEGELEPRYVDHLLRTDVYKSEYLCRSTGIRSSRLRLYPEQFLRIPILCPPPEEQAAILRFLDHADRRIRRYVRSKRKLIALLNEQKQAIIHRAVTRGLDPHVKLKPSGVEWLGDVPEHWDVVPSRAMFMHRNEKAGPDDEILTASQTHGVVSRKEFMAKEGRRVMQVISGREILKRVEENDFVISMRSFEGGLEWSRIQGAISSAYVMLKPTHLVQPRYFARLLKTRAYISALRRTSDLVRDGQALRYANFLQVPLPRVPLREQVAIADFLDNEGLALDRAIRKAQDELRLMQDYRTRLIADVVTGKLDVRKAAAALPNELEAAEPDAEELLDEGEVEDDAELDTESEESEA
jgi:type I restriction enzyme, S subunit